MPRGRKSSGRSASQGNPNPIDVHVGGRVRLRRTLLGMSREKLGDAIGLILQQVQKYERGASRISSSQLFDLARVLDVPLAYFFDEMSASTRALGIEVLRARRISSGTGSVIDGGYAAGRARSPSRLQGIAEQKSLRFAADPMGKREILEMVRAYSRIADPRVREGIFELTKSLAKAAGSPNQIRTIPRTTKGA